MSDEMIVIWDNDIFELVMLFVGRKIVGGCWVFVVKVGLDGGEIYKVWYVVKGYL